MDEVKTYPDVRDLLPHTGQALLLDRVFDVGVKTVDVCAHIDAQHAYYEAGLGVPTWVGLEMLAQACGVHAGWHAWQQGLPTPQGMLLGARHYRTHAPWFVENTTLLVHVERRYGNDTGVSMCSGHIHADKKVLVEATIMVMAKELT